MCGIGGWLGETPGAEVAAQKMASQLRHRGPDGSAVRHFPEATLVHTRLAVVDLSPTGAQPMSDPSGSIWVVFNGEIYNHQQLRADLAHKGHQFRGRSDTEVIPALYREYGPGFVEKLRGMFAIALFDGQTRTLWLYRDRFGIKPLFFAPSRQRLAFCSEIAPLTELPGIDRAVDSQALYDFAALLYIPAPATVFRGIRALEPGQLLRASREDGELRWHVERHHVFAIAADPDLTLEQAIPRAEEWITQAVTRQLESDVPLGSLLSGGIDSSLVSAAAQRATGHLKTFNVQFPDAAYDETWAALEVATRIGSDHETLAIEGAGGSWEEVTALLAHAGQPFADTSIFAVNAVCRRMRERVTVALSGDGGDEGFGGYIQFWQIGWLAAYQALPAMLRRGATTMMPLLARLGLARAHHPESFRLFSTRNDAHTARNLLSWIRESEHRRLCLAEDMLPVARHFERQWAHALPLAASPLERLSALFTEIWTRLILPNDYLFKVDTASMRESLEVRVPMLDEDLFAFGLTLTHRLKTKKQTCKLVLRHVAERQLGSSIAWKKKMGFGVPVDRWVDARFRSRLKDELLDPACRLSEHFSPTVYRPLVEAFAAQGSIPGISRDGLGQRVMMLVSAHVALSRGA